MLGTPPPTVLADARDRTQQAVDAMAPGTIEIDGKSYHGAVEQSAIHWELTEGGFRQRERLAALIPKSEMRDRPSLGAIVTVAGVAYKLTEIGGANPHDRSWRLRGLRTPGSDE